MSVMDVYGALREAGMSEKEAKVVAASVDLSQVATKADLTELTFQMDGRLSKVEDRLSKVEDRLSRVEDQWFQVDGRLSKVEGRLSGLYWFIAAMTVILGLLQSLPFLITLV